MDNVYYYDVYGYEDSIILTHTKKFTDEEFSKMCIQAPTYNGFSNRVYYRSDLIVEHLKDKYGFKEIKPTSKWFYDRRVES